MQAYETDTLQHACIRSAGCFRRQTPGQASLRQQPVVKQGGSTSPATSDEQHDQTSSGVNGTAPKEPLLQLPQTVPYHAALLKLQTEMGQVPRKKLLLKNTSNHCQHPIYILFSCRIPHFPLAGFTSNFGFLLP